MIRDTSKQSTIWVELWSEPNIGTTQLEMNVWHWCSPYRKYDTTWWAKLYIKSQSFKIAYDKAIIIEWSIGEMGYIALPIWDAIPAAKSREGARLVTGLDFSFMLLNR